MRTDLGPGHSRLKPPAAVGQGVVFPPIYGTLSPTSDAQILILRRGAYSTLRPPTVTLAPQPFVAAPVAVTLAPSARQARTPHPNLGPPVVIDLSPQVKYVTVSLAYSRRGVPKSVLRKPTDTVGLEDQGRVKVRLAPSPTQARAPHSRLRPPAVIDLTPQTKYLAVSLAYSRRGIPKSRLEPPAAVGAPLGAAPVRTSLTKLDLRRRQPHSRLPLIVVPPVVYALGGIGIQLARTPRTRTVYLLRPPVAAAAAAVAAVYFGPQTHVVRARRVAAKSVLGAPRVVFLAVEIYGPAVSLTRIKPQPTLATLRPPTDTVGLEDQGRIKVRLAPSPRQPRKTDYRLAAPVAVDLSPQTVYLSVNPTYSRRGKARYGLAAPAVVFIEAPPLARPPLVHLAYSVRKPGEAVLRKPTVVGPVLARPTLVHLAYSRRGEPRSVLGKPTVIDLRPQVYYLSVALARIKHPPTQSFLRPSTVTDALPKAERDLRVTLAYSRRGAPKSELKPPTVIDLRPQTRYLSVTLAYSRRGKPKSLRIVPLVLARAVFFGPAVTLAPQRRGTPRPELRPPTVVRAAFVARPVKVTLAYSRRGTPKSFLREPVLEPPRFFGPTVFLAESRRPVAKYGLAPPAVVGPGIYFRGIQTHMVRITPPPAMLFLKPPTVVNTFHPPAGDVCGTDEPAFDVCGSDSPESRIVGSDTAVGDVCGTDEQST